MDIKDLNKVQLILLALLLSFITSIATGITTVTLMQQAPSSVTVPINRIIKQTVERVVPIEGKTTLETVIIKEEDLVVEAISANQSAIFSLSKEIQGSNGERVEVSAGMGFAVSANGAIVADAILVPGDGEYYAKNSSGKFVADFRYLDPDGFSFLKLGNSVSGFSQPDFSIPAAGDVSEMKRGQKILLLGDTTASFIFEGEKNMKIPVTQSSAGSLVLNLEGEAVGIALLSDQKSFVPIGTVLSTLKSISIE